MRVFVAGASGVVGLRLVPRLLAAGHEVVAMTRTPDKVEPLRALGAEPVAVDALDGPAVAAAVARAAPEVVVHLLTAIPRELDFRHMAAQFALTNRLRTEGTDHLVAAAARAGVRRVVAQSFAPFLYAREGGPVKTEDDPLDVADATARAVEAGPPGAYNVCDDEPARASVWIPHLVAVLGAPPPRRIPVLVARLAIGAHGVAYMASIRGSSNAKARRQLGWTPAHPSWREGFATLVPGSRPQGF